METKNEHFISIHDNCAHIIQDTGVHSIPVLDNIQDTKKVYQNHSAPKKLIGHIRNHSQPEKISDYDQKSSKPVINTSRFVEERRNTIEAKRPILKASYPKQIIQKANKLEVGPVGYAPTISKPRISNFMNQTSSTFSTPNHQS